MTALQIRKPLVMLPFVICEQARIISDGSFYSIHCLKDGIWLDLYQNAISDGEFYSIHCLKDGIWLDLYQNAISIVQMRYRGFVSGIDIEIGDFPPK